MVRRSAFLPVVLSLVPFLISAVLLTMLGGPPTTLARVGPAQSEDTATPPVTITPTGEITASVTLTPTAELTATVTFTPTITATPTPTSTWTATNTATLAPTATHASSPPGVWLCWPDNSSPACGGPTPTVTPTAVPTLVPAMPILTATRTPTPTPTPSQTPLPLKAGLNDVAMVSPTDGWVVGDGGYIQRWDGTTWATIASPTTVNLRAVAMVSPTDGWAVGDSGTIIRWDGRTWQSVSSPTLYSLRDITMLSGTDGWAVGGAECSAYGNTCYSFGVILKWDGQSWTRASIPNNAMLYSVSMVSAMDGWAVGLLEVRDCDRFNCYHRRYGVLLRWRGDQGRWTQEFGQLTYDPWAVQMVSENDGWMLSSSGILRWDGQTWSRFPGAGAPYFRALHMLSTIDGWAVGANGWIWHWNGQEWQPVASPTTAQLLAIAMLPGHGGWALGRDGFGQGVRVRYEPLTITLTPTPTRPAVLPYHLYMPHAAHISPGYPGAAVLQLEQQGSRRVRVEWTHVGNAVTYHLLESSTPSFSSTRTVFAQNNAGPFNHTFDLTPGTHYLRVDAINHFGRSASNIHRVDIPSPPPGRWDCWPDSARCVQPDFIPGTINRLRGLAMLSPSSGWAVGDGGMIARWDEQAWRLFPSPTTRTLMGITMLSETDGWIVGEQGVILRWNGQAWTVVTDQRFASLFGVAMASPTAGWAVGGSPNTCSEYADYTCYSYGQILHWDGQTWRSVPIPIEVGLASVSVVSASDVWAAGIYTVIPCTSCPMTRAGVILRWDGQRWNYVYSLVNVGLRAIVMQSATEGWAAGENGVFLRWDGQIWRKVDTPSRAAVYGMSNIAPTEGWAVGTQGAIMRWDGRLWSRVDSPLSDRFSLNAVARVSPTEAWAIGATCEEIGFPCRSIILRYTTP